MLLSDLSVESSFMSDGGQVDGAVKAAETSELRRHLRFYAWILRHGLAAFTPRLYRRYRLKPGPLAKYIM